MAAVYQLLVLSICIVAIIVILVWVFGDYERGNFLTKQLCKIIDAIKKKQKNFE